MEGICIDPIQIILKRTSESLLSFLSSVFSTFHNIEFTDRVKQERNDSQRVYSLFVG